MSSPCTVPGCDRPARARGYCSMHYNRYRRYGDPSHVSPWKDGTASRRYIASQGSHFVSNLRLWGNYMAQGVIDDRTLHLRSGITEFRRLLNYRHPL